jgi:hypothetical protein
MSEKHKWIGKTPPQYVFTGDIWERETDHKVFKSDPMYLFWYSEDGEKVPFPKKSQVMANRDWYKKLKEENEQKS